MSLNLIIFHKPIRALSAGLQDISVSVAKSSEKTKTNSVLVCFLIFSDFIMLSVALSLKPVSTYFYSIWDKCYLLLTETVQQ